MISDAEAFEYLKLELKETVLSHPIIKRNRYLWWFSQTLDLTKEDLIIERYDAEVTGVKETFPPGASRFNLANKNITNITALSVLTGNALEYTSTGNFSYRVKFINGQSEFMGTTGQARFSLDEKNGEYFCENCQFF